MLLYAKTSDNQLKNNDYSMSGNKISVRTLNMDCDFVQGCEYLQGYLYAKPMPQQEFVRFINLTH